MAFLQVQFFSQVLDLASTVNVILPEPSQGIGLEAAEDGAPPKALYLLHGYSDDHSTWMRRTSVERYAASYDLAVIMPAVNHSFYCNEARGELYWSYVSEELPRIMHRFFRLSDRPEDTFVAGLSMGGYGAMKLALTYPERFAAAGCFSGAVDIEYLMGGKQNPQRQRIFGSQKTTTGTEDDLFYLMERPADRRPRLYVSCGTADFLYGSYRRFVPALRANGWDVTACEKPGEGHSWQFWDEEIAKFIPFAMGDGS